MKNDHQQEPDYNPETVKAVLETVREAYVGQEHRHNLLISKTQTLATVSTLFFTVIAASGVITSAHGPVRLISDLSYFLAVIGVGLCVYVLRSKEFHKVRYLPALDDGELKKKPEIVMINLAKTYDEAIRNSEESHNSLVRQFDKAIILLLVSIVIGGIAVLTSSVRGINNMSNEKPKPAPTQTPAPATPSKPQTSSYGTDTIKKSEDASKPASYGTQIRRDNEDKKKP